MSVRPALRCPRCHVENDLTTSTCRGCGQPLVVPLGDLFGTALPAAKPTPRLVFPWVKTAVAIIALWAAVTRAWPPLLAVLAAFAGVGVVLWRWRTIGWRAFVPILAGAVIALLVLGGAQWTTPPRGASRAPTPTPVAPRLSVGPGAFYPRGVAIDPNGIVYVADAGHDRIDRFAPTGQALRPWGSQGSASGQFEDPAGIALDRAGNLYVADTGNARIQKLSPDGEVVARWGSLGTGDGQFVDLAGLAVDRVGDVFVADRGTHRIQKFSSTGRLIARWESGAVDGTDTSVLNGGLALDGQGSLYATGGASLFKLTPDARLVASWRLSESPPGDRLLPPFLTNVAVDDRGYLYAAGGGYVEKLSPSGQPLAIWGGPGTAPGRFGGYSFVTFVGMAVDSSGDLYVADPANARVQRLSPTGTVVGRLVDGLPDVADSVGPRGIALDGEGNVYVAESAAAWGDERIEKFSVGGQPLAQWGIPRGSWDVSGPWGAAVDGEGQLHVAEWYQSRILTFSPTGDLLGQWRTAAKSTVRPAGIAIDAAGDVYVAEPESQRVEKFDSAGQPLASFGSPGAEPVGVALDARGNLYLVDRRNDRVEKLAPDGQTLAEWGSRGDGPGQLNHPAGIALDRDGNVYVADWGNDRIQKLSPDGVPLASWGEWGSGPGQLAGPSAVAVDASGNLYVADQLNRRWQKLSPTGEFLGQWSTSGADPGQFYHPSGVAVDPRGNVYVADSGNNRIQKLSPTGAPLAQWGTPGFGPGQLWYPAGVALDRQGNVYVADRGNDRVQKLSPDGEPLAAWGSSGTGPGQFSRPTGLAVDRQGNVYVADSGNGRIQKLSPTGQYLAQVDLPAIAVAVDGQDHLVVVDAGADGNGNMRLHVLDSTGKTLAEWGTSGTGPGQFGPPTIQLSRDLWLGSTVAVDPAGNVYVVDLGNDRVQTFSPRGEPLAQWGTGRSSAGQPGWAAGIAVDAQQNVYLTDSRLYRVEKRSSTGRLLTSWDAFGSGLVRDWPGRE